jgi:5-methylcytosine-specific restriction enzyme A
MAEWPYNTTRWKKLRLAKLRSQPLCEDCQARGVIERAVAVDHIDSIKSGGHPFPPLDRLRANCTSCHSRKTSRFDRPDRKAGEGLDYGCDADGRPLDPTNPWSASYNQGGTSGSEKAASGEERHVKRKVLKHSGDPS